MLDPDLMSRSKLMNAKKVHRTTGRFGHNLGLMIKK
jgi:hypothetical protein